mgnify:CR=1 FL=1
MAIAHAAIYVRVSTPGQAEDGLGQEAQLDTCHRIAVEHGLSVPEDHVIVEQASGEYLERTGLDRLRSLVRARLIDALVVRPIPHDIENFYLTDPIVDWGRLTV